MDYVLPPGLYERSRAEFHHESFGKDMRCLQQKLHSWAINAYGWEPAWHYAAGVAEELMELHHESFTKEHRIDAFVDITNFTIQLCTANRLDAQALWDAGRTEFRRATPFSVQSSILFAGKLNQIALKSDLGVRGLKNDDKGRELMRKSYARWIFNIFVESRVAIELATGEPAINVLFKHAEKITQREPKKLPTLNY